MREQTDLPILVRDDTGRYLRAARPARPAAATTCFYFWDEASGPLAVVPGCAGRRRDRRSRSARCGPALTGRCEVTLADGKTVDVRPLLDVLREHLDATTRPSRPRRSTGVSAGDDPPRRARAGRGAARR